MVCPRIGQIWQVVQPKLPFVNISSYWAWMETVGDKFIIKKRDRCNGRWGHTYPAWVLTSVDGVNNLYSDKWLRANCILLEDVNGRHKSGPQKPS